MPAMNMFHEVDPKEVILSGIGDIGELKMTANDVLVAIYLRPEKTKSGIILTDRNRDEDKYQSKVGLVLKMGPDAFVDESGEWFKDVEIKVGDWVWFRPSDGWNMDLMANPDARTLDCVHCRVLKDTSIRGTIPHPDMVW